MGGAAKLAAVKDSTMVAEMQMAAQAGGVKLQQTSFFLAPSSFRQEQSLPFGKVVVYSDGKTGWIQAPQGQIPMSPEILKQAQGTIFRQLVSLLNSSSANAVGEQSVQIAAGDLAVTIEFDAATGLPSRLKYQEAGQAIDETLSDWRDAGGIKLDRRLAERRVYPAIDVDASSTRHEELLFDRKQLQMVWKLRRVLSGLAADGNAAPGLELLIDRLKTFRTNDEFLNEIARQPSM